MNTPKIFSIGSKSYSTEHAVLVEPFDPAKSSGIPNPERFAGRVVFRDGTNVLTPETPQAFAKSNGFRFLGKPDNIATNPDIVFAVEKFDLAEAQKRNPGFKPERGFATRLTWGNGGKGESMLLQNDRDTVIAVVLQGQQDRNDRTIHPQSAKPQRSPGS